MTSVRPSLVTVRFDCDIICSFNSEQIFSFRHFDQLWTDFFEKPLSGF